MLDQPSRDSATVGPDSDTDELTSMRSTGIARRHDLDALRAIAMLLGIVIHSLLSFIPYVGAVWGVQDTQTHPAFGAMLSVIHGFRMPLFFLISGFFTTMLWRKRGLGALMKHRFQRIFLPLAVSLVTIIPVCGAVAQYVAANGGNKMAVAKGDDERQATQVMAEQFVGACCAEDGEPVQRMIAAGADVNGKNRDGSTGLHAAIFFGRSEVVRVLLDAGVDLTVTDKDGRTAYENLYTPWELVSGIAGLFGIKVSPEGVVAGRTEIAEMLKKPFSAEMIGLGDKKGSDVGRKVRTADGGISGLMGFLRSYPLLGHLWFLWDLCILVVGFGVLAFLWQAIGGSKFPAWVTVSPLSYLWWIPLTMVPQSMMGLQGESFGPDTAVTVIPQWPVVVYYAVFFLFGALYFDADDSSGKFGGWWFLALPIAAVVFSIGLSVVSQKAGGGRFLSVFCQVVYAWAMSSGSIGIFRRFMSRESKAMRYVSDSSYWLYLAHIPLVMSLQYVVRDWTMSPFLKCALVCGVSSLLLLISYQLFVRYTPIGTFLNGPRRRLEVSPESSSQPATASV